MKLKKKLINNKNLTNSNSFFLTAILAIVFIILVSVTIVIRIRMLDVPIDRDVGEYAYAGQLMLEGVAPYQIAYNMKLPGIYAAYAAILAIFGQTAFAINLSILIINTATTILLFLLVKKLFGSVAALAAGVFFAITSISYKIQPSANAEHFVVLPAIAGILLLLVFMESKKVWYLITSGLLLGVAFLMKQHAIGFILFCLFFLLWNLMREKPLNYKIAFYKTAIYSFSIVLPFLITCLILWHCGVFEKFWFWTFKYAHQYVTIVPYEKFFIRLEDGFERASYSGRIIWWSTLFGFFSIFWNKKNRRQAVFVIGLLIGSFIAISPGLYYRPHYFIMFLPIIAIMAAMCVLAIQSLIRKLLNSERAAFFASILIIISFWSQSFYFHRVYLKQTDPEIITRFNFRFEPFTETLKVSNFIKQIADKNDKIAVLGSEPQIFFYSHLRSVTPYIYTYALMEDQIYAGEMQQEMIADIEKAKPRFMVYVNTPDSWAKNEKSKNMIFEWASDYVPAHYRQIGLVEIFKREGRILYRWDAFAKPVQPENWIMILERRD